MSTLYWPTQVRNASQEQHYPLNNLLLHHPTPPPQRKISSHFNEDAAIIKFFACTTSVTLHLLVRPLFALSMDASKMTVDEFFKQDPQEADHCCHVRFTTSWVIQQDAA
jgi:hypothetical protein